MPTNDDLFTARGSPKFTTALKDGLDILIRNICVDEIFLTSFAILEVFSFTTRLVFRPPDKDTFCRRADLALVTRRGHQYPRP
jgi:hypothetical protein